jgi:hypothetical protein
MIEKETVTRLVCTCLHEKLFEIPVEAIAAEQDDRYIEVLGRKSIGYKK